VRFCVLGPLRVERDGEELTLGRRQQRALLARLLVEAGRPVSVDRLVDDLWGDEPPPSARGSLQALVSRSRQLLEPDRAAGSPPRVLVSRAPGYALLVPPGGLDADRFVELADEGRRALAAGAPGQALERLDEGLGLWQGDVLADLADETWVTPIASRLQALRNEALELRAEALLACGATGAAVAELEALVAADGLRERPWELLLEALHAAGRTVEALDRYRTVRDRLRDELGLDPGSGLRALEAALLRGDPPGRTSEQAAAPAAPGAAAPPAAPLPAAAPAAPDAAAPPAAPLSAAAPGIAAPAPERPRLVGRDPELAGLTGLVDGAFDGATGWVVLLGEAGVGKTALVRSLTDTAVGRRARLLVGRCHRADLTPAFWPWVQVLRHVDDLVPGLGELLDVGEEGGGGDTTRRLFTVFDRVAAGLTSAAASAPLLVVLEDVHWADVESLQLLDFLAVQLRDVPAAFVLTARQDEVSADLRRSLAELARSPGHLRLELAGLDVASTSALVTSVTGRELAVAEAERLRERTGGNPLFAVELARLGAPALTGDAIPDTVRETLDRRIGRLPAEAAATLTLAAVHGEEFRFDALVASSGLDETSVVEQLDRAFAAGLLVGTDDPLRFRFAHALIRDAAYERLTDLQQRRTHLRVARALRELGPTPDPTAGAETARHLLAAAPLGDPSETFDAARSAAELAEHRLAFHEAAGWWAAALRALEWDHAHARDLRLRLELALALGRCLGFAGDWSAAIQQLATAIEVADELGDPVAMADAAIAFEHTGGFWNWVDYGTRPIELLERLDRVLEVLGDRDPARRVRVLAVRAVGEYYGEQPTGRAQAEEALAAARALDDPALVLAALTANLRFLSHHGLATQLARSQEMLDLARSVGDRHAELFAWTYRVSHLLMAGDLDGSEVAYRAAVDLGHHLGLVIFQAQVCWSEAVYPLARGELAAAEQLIEQARELHASTRLYMLDPVYAWVRLVLLWEADRLDEASDDLLAFLPEAQAAVLARAGRRDAAVALLTGCCSIPHPPIFHALGSLALRARLVADLGLAELAPGLIDQLAPHAELLANFGSVTCVGPVATELGRLHALVGDATTAALLLTRAVERAEAAGWVRWASQARAARAALPASGVLL
jgi:DNA-binding SARP family transcriptional activator/tetratricopeptide (TPR) repeat protein